MTYLTTIRQRLNQRMGQIDLYFFILLLFLGLYIWTFTDLAFDQHQGMRTHKADLGQIAQSVWNSSQGRFLENTDRGYVATRFTDHVEPILVLVSPILWLWKDVRALLLLQVLFAAAGACFLFQLTRRILNSTFSMDGESTSDKVPFAHTIAGFLAICIALTYLLSPHLQSALLTEFHAAPLAVPFILWAFWAVETERWGHFAGSVLFVASIKEEMALLAAGLGLWAAWRLILLQWQERQHSIPFRQYPIILSLFLTLLSLIWFYLSTFMIVPAHAVEVYGIAESGYFQRYGALGSSPLDIIKSFFTQPELVWSIATEPARVSYLWGFLAAFGFLCLLAPELLLLALPVLLANLLSAYPAQYYGEFHYSAPLVPYFAVGTAYGLGRLWRLLLRLYKADWLPTFDRQMINSFYGLAAIAIMSWILLCATNLYLSMGRGPMGGRYDPTPITLHHQKLNDFLSQLPEDASVTATAAVHPHVSLRQHIYQFPIGLEEPGNADWALLDVTTATDMAPGDVKAKIEQMLAGAWAIVDGDDGFLLLKKEQAVGQADIQTLKDIPHEFFNFVLGGSSKRDTLSNSDSELSVRNRLTDGPVSLIGLGVDDWTRWRRTEIISWWQVEEKFDSEIHRPWLEVRTPSGERLYNFADAAPPSLVWYPPEQWQVGDLVQIKTLPLYLPAYWGVIAHKSAENGQEVLVSAYRRTQKDHLRWISPLTFHNDTEYFSDFIRKASDEQNINAATFLTPSEQKVRLVTYIPKRPIGPGGILDIWLQWEGESNWLDNVTPFIHLRHKQVTVTQSDGRPRVFLYAPEYLEHPISDWRQLKMPHMLASGEWHIVAGLYDPVSDLRANVIGEDGNMTGNEVFIGSLTVGPPLVPDQTCALIPTTCWSQILQEQIR